LRSVMITLIWWPRVVFSIQEWGFNAALALVERHKFSNNSVSLLASVSEQIGFGYGRPCCRSLTPSKLSTHSHGHRHTSNSASVTSPSPTSDGADVGPRHNAQGNITNILQNPNTNGGNYWFSLYTQTPRIGVWRTALMCLPGRLELHESGTPPDIFQGRRHIFTIIPLPPHPGSTGSSWTPLIPCRPRLGISWSTPPPTRNGISSPAMPSPMTSACSRPTPPADQRIHRAGGMIFTRPRFPPHARLGNSGSTPDTHLCQEILAPRSPFL